jgi:glycine cleavage system T protein (aminomethyltransferase)
MASAEQASSHNDLKRTPLHALHLELGAKMVPFAGYDMPVNYKPGVIKEHLHTREAAGLFDVSHMGQALLRAATHEAAAAAVEALTAGEILGLAPGRQRYTQLLNTDGGIIDDLMVTRPADPARDGELMLVVNAARKLVDYQHMAGLLPAGVTLTPLEDRALIALQGPAAAEVMAAHCPEAARLGFMAAGPATFDGRPCHISRSGYTGEDGFEISVSAGDAETVARALLANGKVMPVGLGARDTLRLEAGLCLYGHDIDETTSPVEADLVWSMSKRRREQGGFPGAARIQRELADGPARRRVGIRLGGRAPAREGCEIVGHGGGGVGRVTSGSFTPSVGGPIAMGYVAGPHAEPGTPVQLVIRGTPHPAAVAPMPFVAHRYYRKPKSGTSHG